MLFSRGVLKTSSHLINRNLPTQISQNRSLYVLPKLPYRVERGLAPLWTPEELDKHYNKIHLNMIIKANHIVEPTKFDSLPLDEVIKRSSSSIDEAHLNAHCSNVWNHNFVFFCLSPNYVEPSELLMEAFRVHFNGFQNFKKRFSQYAQALHGSGFTWLVDINGQWQIVNTYNSQTPLSMRSTTPLLVLDVWEHAYYGNYLDNRIAYIENFFKVVNWTFVEEQYRNIDRSELDHR